MQVSLVTLNFIYPWIPANEVPDHLTLSYLKSLRRDSRHIDLNFIVCDAHLLRTQWFR